MDSDMADIERDKKSNHEEKEESGGLLKFTIPGFALGLLLGAYLDTLGFQRSAV